MQIETNRLKGRTALITGCGSETGIGFATANLLLSQAIVFFFFFDNYLAQVYVLLKSSDWPAAITRPASRICGLHGVTPTRPGLRCGLDYRP